MEKTFEGFFKKHKKQATHQDIIDSLQDLIDYGFKVRISKDLMSPVSSTTGKFITIKIRSGEYFKYKDVKETLLFAMPYLRDVYGLKTKCGSFTYFDNGETVTKNYSDPVKMYRFLGNRNLDLIKLDIYIS